tara:strand:+ start:601 stop:879 length:279 start_codon:yes stop_codon:yes gene_type:complete
MEFGKLCDCQNIVERMQTFKNNTQHLRLECADCGKFLGFKQQPIDPQQYIIHFGKYKGKKLSDCPDDYLEWLRLQSWIKDNLKFALDELINV